jgi:lipopolysaccharide transport system ATP-binding protein
MRDVAIQVEGLSKRYRIGRALHHNTLRDAIVDALSTPLRHFRKAPSSSDEETFWALRNVSFEVNRGEVLGVIGRNGAGKSTLLKVLSRITEPTEGEAWIRGRVGSLLEVGTGFHPELTGRENVFLNGAILGMKQSEIARKFDEIVAFAEVEKFIDTPVKRYSSGMYVRLAFAVAAHLESDILIVDEVLSVGDAEFQKKSIGKMREVAASCQRTVLFVTHNLAAVQNLCSRAILLEQGSVVVDSSVMSATGKYLDSMRALRRVPLFDRTNREGTGEARLVDIRLLDSNGAAKAAVPMGEDWHLRLTFDCKQRVSRPEIRVVVDTDFGQRVSRISSSLTQGALPYLEGRIEVRCHVSRLNLTEGLYTLTVRLGRHDGEIIDRVESAMEIEIVAANELGTGRVGDNRASPCYFPAKWKVEVVKPQSDSLEQD